MEFGICAGPDRADAARAAGFDYVEWSVGGYLRPRDDDAAFAESRAAAAGASLPIPAVNMFVPGDLKITGPAADLAALEEYVTAAFDRAAAAGVGIIVFGSGGARKIPDGFSRQEARQQVVDFGRMFAPLAHDCGVTVVAEPLNAGECNIGNSVDECAGWVRDVDHPGFRLLCDAYHMLLDDDPMESIRRHGDILVHAHLATVPGRRPPGAEECDLQPFFNALVAAGYGGRVSFEGRLEDAGAELPRALERMRTMEQRARDSQ